MLNRSFMAHGRRAKTKDLLFSQKQRLASSAHWHLALARPTAATVLGCLIARFGFGGNGQACCATVQSVSKLIEHPDAVLSSLNNRLLEPKSMANKIDKRMGSCTVYARVNNEWTVEQWDKQYVNSRNARPRKPRQARRSLSSSSVRQLTRSAFRRLLDVLLT